MKRCPDCYSLTDVTADQCEVCGLSFLERDRQQTRGGYVVLVVYLLVIVVGAGMVLKNILAVP